MGKPKIDQADPEESEVVTNDEPGRAKRFLSRDREPLVLLLAALVFGVCTYLIYTKAPPVTIGNAIQRITVVGPLKPTAIDVNEEANSTGGIQLAVALRAPAPQSVAVSSERLVVAVSSPAARHCPPKAIACPSANGARTLYYRFNPQRWRDFGTNAIQAYQFGVVLAIPNIPNVHANLAQDDQDVVTSLPPVSVLSYVYAPDAPAPEPSYFADPPVVDYGERVDHGGDYTWQQGTTPVDTGGWDHWWFTSATSASVALSPVVYTGTDLGVQSWNSNLTFVAGILVGLAGGALIGALQAAVSKRSD